MNRGHRARLMNPTTLPSAGVLVLRVVVGVTFVLHGLDKLGDLAGAEQFFASLDIPAPGLTAPAVAVTEIVGGVLLIAGLATPLVGAALAIDMLVALLLGGASSASASRVPGASASTPHSTGLSASCSECAV